MGPSSRRGAVRKKQIASEAELSTIKLKPLGEQSFLTDGKQSMLNEGNTGDVNQGYRSRQDRNMNVCKDVSKL